MYKTIILNSNMSEAESLSGMISDDFSVENMFSDCRGAVEYIKNNFADIVITDATASFSALQFFLQKGCEVLMLCGYREMDAAKEASDAGVKFYLLKPVRFDEFTYAMSSLKLELDRRNISRLQNLTTLNFQQFLPILREQFFSEVANGKIASRQELREKTGEFSVEQSVCTMPCGVAEVHIVEYQSYISGKWKYGRETLYTAIKNLLSDTEQFTFQLVRTGGSLMRFIVIPSNNISVRFLEDLLRAYIKKCTKTAFELFELLIFIDVKKIFPTLFELTEYTYENGASPQGIMYSDSVGRIVSEIKLYRSDSAKRILEKCFNDFESSSRENTSAFLLNILHIVCEQLFSDSVSEEMKERADFVLSSKSPSDEPLLDKAKSLIDEFSSYMRRHVRKTDDIVINKAREFIKNNCGNDISLSDVADFVYLNPVYFSRMFKQKTGHNFSEYLLKMRMERAKELFDGETKAVKDTARQVGFKNAKYFSRLFKNYTGLTPREYMYRKLERKK